MSILPRAVKPPVGHKTSGTPYMMFVLYCECGWKTAPNPERAGAYADWRSHALAHGGTLESFEDHEKREARYLRKIAARASVSGDQ